MRTSPIYYIAPSDISITPNANGSQRDVAVHVERGAKIKVCYQPIAELDYSADANYMEWTLTGRNRRLSQTNVSYTIYARLNKTDQTDGYLVFAQQVKAGTGGWSDPYILSPNTSAASDLRLYGADNRKYLWPAIPQRQVANGRSRYWWIKIGEVSAPDENGQRTVDLDTGILGTDQYNSEWYIDPDKMPQRPVRVVEVERGDWTANPTATYTGDTGSMTPDGTLDASVALALGWTGMQKLSFEQGQQISEPYHFKHLTRCRWLTHRLATYNAGYTDAELYEKLTTPSKGWEEENWVETSRVRHNGKQWECQVYGTTAEPSEDTPDWLMVVSSGEDGENAINVELTKSNDAVVIDPSGNVVGGYRTVSKDSSGNEFYTYRFHTSVTVMKGGEYLHLCGALDDDEQLGDGNFTVEAIGSGCELKVEGTTCYITYIWHCNDGDASTDPYTSFNRTPEEYQQMRAMTEAVAHITLNIEGKTAVTKDYRLQLVHLPTDTVIIESHNEVAAVNWSTKKNAWTNKQDIVIPLTASSGGQPVMFQTVNGGTAPDITLLNKPAWLSGTPGFSVKWADYDEDGDGRNEYTAAQHMAVEITIPIANIRKIWQENGATQEIPTTNLLKFNVTTVVDGVEYENVVPLTLNVTTDKAVYVLAPSTKQVVGTMIGGTWDPQTNTVKNARYSYVAAGEACNKVTCRLMCYDQNDNLTEITSASQIHDNLTFFINGAASSLDAFRNTGVSNTAVGSTGHNLFDELSEIVFAIKMDGKDYESEGVPILRNGANLSIGDDGNWYIGGVNTEVFAKGTEVTDTFIYYTDPMDGSTPPVYAPTDSQRGKPVSPYLKTTCPASVEGKFIHYVSITVFSDSEETYVYSYGTIGTGNTITVIHDRDFYASASELTQTQLKAIPEASWSESTPGDYSAEKKYLYSRDTARYYKNGAEQTVTIDGIAYPRIVYTMLAYWGQDGSGVEFAYYRAADDTAANKPTVTVLNQRHAGTAKNPAIPDWNGSDGGWYDDNPGFTTQGQVMYQSVNKYTNGQWSGWGDPVIIDRYAQNAPEAFVTPDKISIPCKNDGGVKTQVQQTLTFSMSVGAGSATIKSITASTTPTGVSISGSSGETRTVTVGTSATDSGLKSGVSFTVVGTYNGKDFTAKCTVALIGSVEGASIQGNPGKTGCWYYYAGPWAPGSYTMQETQAPYVMRHCTINNVTADYFFMLDFGTSDKPAGSTTTLDPASHYNPVSGKGEEPWTLMQSQMQYYIAQAFFGPYAHFGAFIINGDWMISQYGTLYDSSGTAHEINGTSSYGGYTKDNAYTLFNPQYPASSQPGANNFCPNFAVDGKTGNTIQGKGIFRGEVHATSGEFNGTVKANLFYSRTKWFDMPANDYQTYYIDPVSEPYSNFGVAPAQAFHGVVTIYLPIAADYDGIEFTFFSAPFEQYQTGAMDILPKSDDNLYVYSESSKKYVAASAIVPMKGIAKVKSFNGKWFLIEGDPSEAVLKTS